MSTPNRFSHRNIEFSCQNPDSPQAFEEIVTAYLRSGADVPGLLTDLLNHEPDMTMAVCLQGYLLKLAAHPKLKPTLDEMVARAQTLRDGCTERERDHINVLTDWAHDRTERALARLEALLSEHPTDMLALRIAHYMHFYNGIGREMSASTGRVLHAWSEEHPQYGYLLGMHAFGLEESGQLREAESYGRDALAMNPHDLWSIHAVDHVLYMDNRHDEGISWLEENRQHHAGTNNFRYHLDWHGAIHALALGNEALALDIYDAQLADSISDDFYLDMCNNASLLARLESRDVNVGERWQALAEMAETHIQDEELVFASLHYLLALLRGKSAHAADFVEHLEAWSQAEGHQAMVCRNVGLPIARSMSDHAISLPDTTPVGGSIAQRELFTLLA